MPIFSMEVADLDEFYPAELTEMELLSQKIYSLGRFQAAISEKLEGEFIRPPKQVTAWINFFSTEIKNILAMERRLCDENSEESLGLLQSVVQQLKTMKRYITDHMEPTSVYSDLVSDSTQKSSISLAEEEEESLDCKLIPPFIFEKNENSTVLDSHEQIFFPNWNILMDTFQIKKIPGKVYKPLIGHTWSNCIKVSGLFEMEIQIILYRPMECVLLANSL
ncbi:uncharacterized protein LOC113330578 isoform X1 [Papaver somniferum]|uniref:uncharacterized protein LOC113330578 isoform X1 n=1 Tax=Papaver somniferum TaxID=3469 RepID=UPI000E6F5063|nr:uncharacterized protein LOC113330578 isoform X1 [Papaver somniferum]